MKLWSALPVVAALSLVGMTAFAQKGAPAKAEAGWFTDFAKAQAQAKKSGKILMVDFNATWCGPCQMYKKQVFPGKNFKAATKDVILASIDTDKNPALAQKLGVSGIPDIRFFTPSGKPITLTLERGAKGTGLVGFGGEARLISAINQAKKLAKK